MRLIGLFRTALIAAIGNLLLFSSSFAKIDAEYVRLHNHEQLGEIPIDLALGAAALTAKMYDEALFTYDRVLINDPQNHTALLGKLEALIKLEQFSTASLLVQRIKQLPLTPNEKKHLQDLERSLSFFSKFRHQLRGSLSFGLDNNAGIASSDSASDYENFLASTYSFDDNHPISEYVDYYTKNNEKLASPYIKPELNYNGRYQFHQLLTFYWDFGFDRTQFLRYSNYNVTHNHYSIGFNHKFGRLFLQESFYAQNYFFDGKRYRDTFLGLFSAGYYINDSNLLRIYGAEGELIYPHYRRSNVYTHTGGVEWRHFNERYTFNLRWSYNRHKAKNYIDEPPNYAARHAYITYLAATFNVIRDWTIGSEFLHQYSNYDRYRPNHKKRRRDNFYNVNVVLSYQLNQYCDVYIKGDYTINTSNLVGYSYRHFVSSTGINFKI